MKTTSSANLKFAAAKFLAATPAKSIAFVMLSHLKAAYFPIQGVDLLRARIRLAEGSMTEAREMLKEELRFHPDNTEASELLAKIETNEDPCEAAYHDKDFQWILKNVRPYTMLSIERLFALYTGAKAACSRRLSGNFVECGVAGGGSSALLAWVIKNFSDEPRALFCCDTFEGMPWPGAEDRHAGKSAQSTGWGAGTCAAPVSSLLQIAGDLGVKELIRPIKGLFQESLPRIKGEIGPIALLHLDGDWYDSTRAILENLYEQTRIGAYVQIDDYGYWDGCRKAVDDFEAQIGRKFSVNAIDATGVWFTKSP
jgi:O-methyltransferase